MENCVYVKIVCVYLGYLCVLGFVCVFVEEEPSLSDRVRLAHSWSRSGLVTVSYQPLLISTLVNGQGVCTKDCCCVVEALG